MTGPASPHSPIRAVGIPARVLGDAETLMAQLGQMFRRRPRLGVTDLGHRPDLVAELDESRLDRIYVAPNVAAVVHCRP